MWKLACQARIIGKTQLSYKHKYFCIVVNCMLSSSYIYPEERLPLLLQEVNKFYSELVIDSNAESFDSAYFSGIVFSSDTCFKNLPERSSTMLAINFGENIINYFHQKQGQKVPTVPSLKKKMMHYNIFQGML